MKRYKKMGMQLIAMEAGEAILQCSIQIQTLKFKVDEYVAKPEETLDFNLDSFDDKSFE